MAGVNNQLAEKHVPYVVPRKDWLAGPEGRKADRVCLGWKGHLPSNACLRPKCMASEQIEQARCCASPCYSPFTHHGNQLYFLILHSTKQVLLTLGYGCRWGPPMSCIGRTWRQWPPSGTTSPEKSGMTLRCRLRSLCMHSLSVLCHL